MIYLLLEDRSLQYTDTFRYRFHVSAQRTTTGNDLYLSGRILMLHHNYVIELDSANSSYYQPTPKPYGGNLSLNTIHYLLTVGPLPNGVKFKDWNVLLYREFINGYTDIEEIGVKFGASYHRNYNRSDYEIVTSSYS